MKPLKATSRLFAHTWTIVLVPEYVSSCQHLFAYHFPDAKLSWSNPIELGNWSKTTKFGIDTGPKRNRRVTRRRRKNYSDNGCSTAPSSGYKKCIENPPLFWFSIQVAQKRGWLRMLKAFLPHERQSKYSDYPEIDEVGKAYKRSAIIIDELFLVMRFSISNPCYVLSEKILTLNGSS